MVTTTILIIALITLAIFIALAVLTFGGGVLLVVADFAVFIFIVWFLVKLFTKKKNDQ